MGDLGQACQSPIACYGGTAGKCIKEKQKVAPVTVTCGLAKSAPPSFCYSCPRGRYKEGYTDTRTTIASCKYCPIGYENFETASNACDQCIAGKYQDQTLATTYGCKACEIGKYGVQTGRTSEAGACKECNKGRWSSALSTQSCTACGRGKYNIKTGSVVSDDCLLCAPGRYSNHEVAISPADCAVCTPGRYQNQAGESDCIDCGSGRYSIHEAATTLSNCLQCDSGTEQPLSIGISCAACGLGKYAFAAGTSNCLGCEAGRYQDQESSTSCVGCPIGRNLVDTSGAADFHSSIDSCTLCPVRTYNPAIGWSGACFACAGNGETVAATTCDGCDPGKFKDTESGGTCTPCLRGKHTDAMDLPICRTCPSGWYATEQEPFVRCVRCGRGKFGNSQLYGAADGAPNNAVGCINCVAGRYSAAESLASSVGQIPCKECPLGRWSSNFGVDKESQCLFCAPGKYNNVRASSDGEACVRCLAGKILAPILFFLLLLSLLDVWLPLVITGLLLF